MINKLREQWDKIMGKETTSTYTVTVTHNGPVKDFEKIFKRRGTIIDTSVVRTSTKTVKTEPVSMYTDEEKMVRLFIKTAAEKADLVYGGGKRFNLGHKGTYHIAYDSYYGDQGYSIRLCGVSIKVSLPNGVGNAGTIEVHDYKERAKKERNGSSTYDRKYRGGMVPNEAIAFSITDPKIEEQLITLFKKWGNLYSVDNNY